MSKESTGVRLLKRILTLYAYVYLQEVNLETLLDLQVPQYLLPRFILHGLGHEPHEHDIDFSYIPNSKPYISGTCR